MELYSQMEKEVRDRIEEFVRYRWEHLESMRSSLEDHAIKFLFGTNAGGTAALLAFIGSTSFVPPTSVISLALFILGLLLTGLGIALGYNRIARLQTGWNDDAADMFAGKMEWTSMLQGDKKRLKERAPGKVLAWSAFACWILGTTFGFASLVLFLCNR